MRSTLAVLPSQRDRPGAGARCCHQKDALPRSSGGVPSEVKAEPALEAMRKQLVNARLAIRVQK